MMDRLIPTSARIALATASHLDHQHLHSSGTSHISAAPKQVLLGKHLRRPVDL
jgi:hypothetical protein